MEKNDSEHTAFLFDKEFFLLKITSSKIIIQSVFVGLLSGLLVVAFKSGIEIIEKLVHTFSSNFPAG